MPRAPRLTPPVTRATIGATLDTSTARPATTFTAGPPRSQTTVSLSLQSARYAALTALVIGGTLATWFFYNREVHGYVTDDAYISFRYAENLSRGIGPVWSPGNRVEGYTNFGWVLALAVAIKSGFNPLDASRGLGVLASAGTLALIPLLAAQLRPAWSLRWWLLVTASTAAVALNSAFATWIFAGLETTVFAFFLTAAATAHLYEERTDRHPIWSALALLAAALLRPDAIVAFVVTASYKVIRLSASRQIRERAPAFALWLALFAIPFAIYWIWRWNYYGYFYPNTYYLKTGHDFDLVDRGGEYAMQFVRVYWMWLVIAAALPAWRERMDVYRPVTYLLALSTLWLLYIAYTGGDWMPYFRFFVPIVPLVYVVMFHGAIEVAAWIVGRARLLRSRQHIATPALAAVFAAGIAYICVTSYGRHDAIHAPRVTQDILQGDVDLRQQRPIGLWMRNNLPPDYTVALIASGVVPYYSRLPTIDLLGVNDEHIAHLDVPVGFAMAGHDKHDGAYILSRQPEIIWLDFGPEPEPRSTIADYGPPRWYAPFPLWSEIIENPYTFFLYRPVAVRLAGGWLNLLVHDRVDIPSLPKSTSEIDARTP